MGNSFFNTNNSIITNKNGEVFTAGTSANLITIASSGAFEHELEKVHFDAFLSKIDKYGNLRNSLFFQSNFVEMGSSIQIDTMLNSYLLGTKINIDSSNLDSNFEKQNLFIVKIDKFGNLVYYQDVENELNEFDAQSITDFAGNLYVSSSFENTQSSDSPFLDVQLRKFSPDGNLSWQNTIAGEKNDYATGISYGNHHVIVVGMTKSETDIHSNNAYQTELNGSEDGFIAQFDSLGTRVWSSYFGGENLDQILGVKAFNEDIFIVGKTNSTSEIATATAFQDSLSGNFDAFVANFSIGGNLLWSSYFGGTDFDEAVHISRELDSNIFILGNTYSSDSISFGDVYQASKNDMADAFICKFTPRGERIWSSFYGGEMQEKAQAIHVFGNTSIYVCGQTNSTSHISDAQKHEFGEFHSGDFDGFVSKFTQDKSTIFLDDIVIDSLGNYHCSGQGGSDGYENEFGQFISTFCEGDTVFLHFNQGELGTDAEWVWYLNGCGEEAPQIGVGESIFHVPTSSCSYFVRAESVSNSTQCVEFEQEVNPLPIVQIFSDSNFCIGQDFTLSTLPFDSISWTKNNSYLDSSNVLSINNASFSDSGSYTVYVQTIHSCSSSDLIYVHLHDSPNYSKISNDEICGNNQGSIKIEGLNENDSLFWLSPALGNSSMLDSLIEGTYIFGIVNEHGCLVQDTIEISEGLYATFDTLVLNPSCGFSNASIEIIPSGEIEQYTFLWNTEEISSKIDSLNAGYYSLEIRDSLNCVYPFEFQLFPTGSLDLAINPADTTLFLGDSLVLTALPSIQDSSLQYFWLLENDTIYIDFQEITIAPTVNSTYHLFIKNEYNCIGNATSFVQIELMPEDTVIVNPPDDTTVVVIPNDTTIVQLPGDDCIELFIPRFFSPNGDFLNDEWCVIGNCVLSMHLRIFNQWNELIFESTEQENCWDGNYRNVPVQNDQYFYSLSIETLNEGSTTINGTVNVLR
jgi:gliding motility-associated-like protein